MAGCECFRSLDLRGAGGAGWGNCPVYNRAEVGVESSTDPVLVQSSLVPQGNSLLTSCCYDQVRVEARDGTLFSAVQIRCV